MQGERGDAMFEVVRVRLAITDDGDVLAVLGAQIQVPGGLAVEVRREGMTEQAWNSGLWLRPGDLD
jgi:hypothetical protein